MDKEKVFFAAICVILCLLMPSVFADDTKFMDVPEGDFFEQYIYKLKDLDITSGKAKNIFGYNEFITRAEFLTFLIRTLGIDTNIPPKHQAFEDITGYHWYAPFVSVGLEQKIILLEDYPDQQFKADQFITRGEMAVMIVRALGYEYLAELIISEPSRFEDVTEDKGYIELARDFGIINGKSETQFAPTSKALRQEAAAMLIRMYNTLNHKLEDSNAFYAIRSYPQANKIEEFSTVSYGWSRIEYNAQSEDVELVADTPSSTYPYYIPEGYQEVIDIAEGNNVKKYLMVFGTNAQHIEVADEKIGLVSYLLRDEDNRERLASTVAQRVYNEQQDDALDIDFDGVVIDFEEIRDVQKDKQQFIDFLKAVKQGLDKGSKDLVVCVHPKREPGQAFFDGYDYKQIGEIADKVILMAHDYAPYEIRSEEKYSFMGDTPLAPIKNIYYALRYATDKENGIPRDKLIIQVSFGTIQWHFGNGQLLNDSAAHPSYSELKEKMEDASVEDKQFNYSSISQAPYFKYTDSTDGADKIVWYEDERSINAKIQLAKMFGLRGVSVWRLGQIPDFEDMHDQTYPHYLNLWDVFENIMK